MRKLIYHPLGIVIITFTVVILCISLYISSHQFGQASQRVELLKQQVIRTQNATNELASQVKSAQSPFAQEALIRNQLLQQKPGEYVVQMPDVPAPSPSPTPTPAPVPPASAWKALLF